MQIIIRYKKEVLGSQLYEYFFYLFGTLERTPDNWVSVTPIRMFGIRWGYVLKTRNQIDN